MNQALYITSNGFLLAKNELTKLLNEERPNVVEQISKARALGDLSENAEYHAAKAQQFQIEKRISYLENLLSRSEVINYIDFSTDNIKFGATVEIKNCNNMEVKKIFIAGEYESQLSPVNVSVFSPLGKALIGRSVSDIIEVDTPSGVFEYEVMSIIYK